MFFAACALMFVLCFLFAIVVRTALCIANRQQRSSDRSRSSILAAWHALRCSLARSAFLRSPACTVFSNVCQSRTLCTVCCCGQCSANVGALSSSIRSTRVENSPVGAAVLGAAQHYFDPCRVANEGECWSDDFANQVTGLDTARYELAVQVSAPTAATQPSKRSRARRLAVGHQV